jgi:hypothetical protein
LATNLLNYYLDVLARIAKNLRGSIVLAVLVNIIAIYIANATDITKWKWLFGLKKEYKYERNFI